MCRRISAIIVAIFAAISIAVLAIGLAIRVPQRYELDAFCDTGLAATKATTREVSIVKYKAVDLIRLLDRIEAISATDELPEEIRTRESQFPHCPELRTEVKQHSHALVKLIERYETEIPTDLDYFDVVCQAYEAGRGLGV
ncbi:hypothetical protein LTR37_020441 [Vermiconidia calcicola]|uniref:Uncharacterized protein n=1 Tax=Vermiconidia calcicola TaxID=1690605 RepID=A0ACC3MBC3_9PEZI|nr:hypothetical protein LTR37_020441 [Vermiconidia calcicola]